jgi:hypothetical protein
VFSTKQVPYMGLHYVHQLGQSNFPHEADSNLRLSQAKRIEKESLDA